MNLLKGRIEQGPERKGANNMMSLVILTVIFIIAITLLSFISKRIEKKVLFPISFVFISIIVFGVSFFVGGWEGIGLGAVSASLFIASIIFNRCCVVV